MAHDTTPRALAIMAGTLFTAGAIAVLLEDVLLHDAPWKLKHALTIVIVGGTMLAGHLAAEAVRTRKVLATIGFALVFISGTALTVYSSVGRQAETSSLTTAEAEATNEARTAARNGLKQADAMLADAQRDLARECKTGKGSRCAGIRSTVDVYEAAAHGHRADLERLGPAKPVQVEAEQFGKIASVMGFDHDKAKVAALLMVPFLTTLFLEFGAIVSLGYGFANRRPGNRDTADNPDEIRATVKATVANDDQPSPPKGGHRRTVATRAAAEADVIRLVARGEQLPSQDTLASRWGVHKGTVSKWLGDFEARGLIARRVEGRCKRVGRVA